MIKQAIFLMLLLPFWANAQTQSPPPTKQETIEWILKKMKYVGTESCNYYNKDINLDKMYFRSDLIYKRVNITIYIYMNKASEVQVGESGIVFLGEGVALEHDNDDGTNTYVNRAFFCFDPALETNLTERFKKAFDALIDFNKVGKPAEKY